MNNIIFTKLLEAGVWNTLFALDMTCMKVFLHLGSCLFRPHPWDFLPSFPYLNSPMQPCSECDRVLAYYLILTTPTGHLCALLSGEAIGPLLSWNHGNCLLWCLFLSIHSCNYDSSSQRAAMDTEISSSLYLISLAAVATSELLHRKALRSSFCLEGAWLGAFP